MSTDEEIQMIDVDAIRILNPRSRDKRRYKAIVESIINLGLKVPIVVSPFNRNEEGSSLRYDLVCGQGRLEAFIGAGEKQIPARVINVPKDDCLLMSLIENIARRRVRRIELIKEILRLRSEGYSAERIGRKIDCSAYFVSSIVRLHDRGEERLVDAALNERIPIGVAVTIADASDEAEVQDAILQAYKSGEIPYRGLRSVKGVLNQRRFLGKSLSTGVRSRSATRESLVSAYRKEADRQKRLVRKARLCETRLAFLRGAFGKLLGDDNFKTLLRAEELDTMPAPLAELLGIKNGKPKENQTSV